MRDDPASRGNAPQVAPALLTWYDAHARVLPWRISPADRAAGIRPDPYRVWLSEVMLQQTTVAAVRAYFRRFTDLWPDVASLAAAPDAQVMAEWAGLGYYARARNLLACARAVAGDHGSRFPGTAAALRTLPGIGPYTAAAIAAIAFDEPATVVDGNVERVTARLFAVTDPLPRAKPRLTALAATITPQTRPGDFAQAMMDLGATLCTPRNPACALCPLSHLCQARALGIAATLPAKARKSPKPQRHGIAFVARRADGAYLLETRPARGLLGGMLGWPVSDWAETEPEFNPPLPAQWIEAPVTVRHSFTHFDLWLRVFAALVPAAATPPRGEFLAPPAFAPAGLPTLMRKAFDTAQPLLAPLSSSSWQKYPGGGPGEAAPPPCDAGPGTTSPDPRRPSAHDPD